MIGRIASGFLGATLCAMAAAADRSGCRGTKAGGRRPFKQQR